MSKVAAGVISFSALALTVTTGVVVTNFQSEPTTVVRVIDGDTLDVRVDGDVERVRLLNVDTPETKHPERDVECLGPEATAFLEEQLSPGDEVELEFDAERRDRYDRLLAGVYSEGKLVNAEIARAGLGAAAYYAPNRRFLPEVQEAQEEARSAGVGLFSEDIACTVPAALSAFDEQMAVLPATVPEEMTELEELVAAIGAVAAASVLVSGTLDNVELYPDSAVGWAFRDDVDAEKQRVVETMGDVTTLEDSAEERIDEILEEERIERERREAEREEQREQERREAERVEAERVAAEQEQKAAESREPQRAAPAPRNSQESGTQTTRQPAPPAVRQESEPPSTSNGSRNQAPPEQTSVPPGHYHRDAPTNYTGPRCYAPGGQSWRPCG